jgi:hypothetical protein
VHALLIESGPAVLPEFNLIQMRDPVERRLNFIDEALAALP